MKIYLCQKKEKELFTIVCTALFPIDDNAIKGFDYDVDNYNFNTNHTDCRFGIIIIIRKLQKEHKEDLQNNLGGIIIMQFHCCPYTCRKTVYNSCSCLLHTCL